MKDNEDQDKNEKLVVTGTDHESNQTLQPRNIEVECANIEAATENEIHLGELKSCFCQIHY